MSSCLYRPCIKRKLKSLSKQCVSGRLLLSFLLTFILCVKAWAKEPEILEMSTPANTSPNIVLLLADDLGYGELGSYGQKEILTPVLDNLAKNGARFTNFYAGSPVCSPSRAVLMTGLPSAQVGIRGNSGYFGGDVPWQRVTLTSEEVTIAENLKKVGYQTAFVGKWHLDDANDIKTWAINRGFDQAAQEQWAMRAGGEKFHGFGDYINGNSEVIRYKKEDWNSKDEFRTSIAFDFLDNTNRDEPFFLFMSYRAPHGHEQLIGNKELYKDKNWPEAQRVHAAKITLLDRYIGQLIQKLEDMNELENTLILFTSDNGAHAEGNDPTFFESNGVFKGIKRDLYEGGVRVPLIAYWKDRISPRVINGVSSFVDIAPTIETLAGFVKATPYSGISLAESILGQAENDIDQVVQWEFQLDGKYRELPKGGFRQAIRIGSWKAVRYGINQKTELYNLESDPSEQINLAKKHPDIVKKAESHFEIRSKSKYYPYGGVVE